MSNELSLSWNASGAAIYALLFNPAGLIWNGLTFIAPASADWADYAIALTEVDTSAVYQADFPGAIATAGNYRVSIRLQVGVAPALTDTICDAYAVAWPGTVITTPTSAGSYAAAADVAALTQRYTNAGVFDTGTTPTAAMVEQWIADVSAILDILLSEQDFVVPVTQTACVSVLRHFVVMQVSDLVQYANSAGRFFTDKALAAGPWSLIQKDAADFIEKHATGFQNRGAARKSAGLTGLAFNELDSSGKTIEPMFSRKQFKNSNTDWDPS